jgi:hypothetical protein
MKGKVDINKIAAAGHSCGGLEATSNSYHNYPQVKLTTLSNIAIFQDNKRYLLKELKTPIAYFIGGPNDRAFPNVKTTISFPMAFQRTTPASTAAI